MLDLISDLDMQVAKILEISKDLGEVYIIASKATESEIIECCARFLPLTLEQIKSDSLTIVTSKDSNTTSGPQWKA